MGKKTWNLVIQTSRLLEMTPGLEPANTATLWHSLFFPCAKMLYTKHLNAISLIRGIRLIELAFMLAMLCQRIAISTNNLLKIW